MTSIRDRWRAYEAAKLGGGAVHRGPNSISLQFQVSEIGADSALGAALENVGIYANGNIQLVQSGAVVNLDGQPLDTAPLTVAFGEGLSIAVGTAGLYFVRVSMSAAWTPTDCVVEGYCRAGLESITRYSLPWVDSSVPKVDDSSIVQLTPDAPFVFKVDGWYQGSGEDPGAPYGHAQFAVTVAQVGG